MNPYSRLSEPEKPWILNYKENFLQAEKENIKTNNYLKFIRKTELKCKLNELEFLEILERAELQARLVEEIIQNFFKTDSKYKKKKEYVREYLKLQREQNLQNVMSGGLYTFLCNRDNEKRQKKEKKEARQMIKKEKKIARQKEKEVAKQIRREMEYKQMLQKNERALKKKRYNKMI